MTEGDSKTAPGTYQATLTANTIRTTAGEYPATLAVSGRSVATGKAAVDADLATRNGNPRWALMNFGANDTQEFPFPLEADWKANYLYMIDAFQTKWPGIRVLIMRPWRRGYTTECNTMAGWISDICGLRSNVGLGPDERVFLENGDNGITYTSDGVHPTAAGYILTAQQWQSAMGL